MIQFMLITFIVTVFIEGLLIIIIKRDIKYLYYSVLCNMFTQPVLDLLSITVFPKHEFGIALCLYLLFEIIAIVAEAYIYEKLTAMTFFKSLRLSFTLNLASCVLGLILSELIYNLSGFIHFFTLIF